MEGSSSAREQLGHSVNTTEKRVQQNESVSERQGQGRRGAVTRGFPGAPKWLLCATGYSAVGHIDVLLLVRASGDYPVP